MKLYEILKEHPHQDKLCKSRNKNNRYFFDVEIHYKLYVWMYNESIVKVFLFKILYA